MELSVSFTLRQLYPNWIGGWVGPRVVLDAAVKRKIPSPYPDKKKKISLDNNQHVKG
jgi:hypothetical protein